jgi:4-deoxy-L-threo-5-hexosulose-uronate ketol-isomerase
MMEIRYSADQIRYQRLNTEELRATFLLQNLFNKESLDLVYSDIDRAIIGSAVPVKERLTLIASKEIASDYFTQRREIGVINIGGKGSITVEGQSFNMNNRDGLYIGRGNKEINFDSDQKADPAYYYILSYPAHREYPTTHVSIEDAEPLKLGSKEESNERTIYKLIHPNGIKSCQLVMGFTELVEGCIWNTMSAHTHERRTEVYMYYGLDDDTVVFHFMGKPDETRHIVIRNREAVLSPSWSIHSGAGTKAYSFVWGMGGENQDFGDMDGIDIKQLM